MIVLEYSFRTAHCAADEKGLLQASLFETSVESSLSSSKLFQYSSSVDLQPVTNRLMKSGRPPTDRLWMGVRA